MRKAIQYWWKNSSQLSRRIDVAVASMIGGAAVMTGFAGVSLFLLSGTAGYVFWLALAAHVQVMLCLGALAAFITRRKIIVNRDGVQFQDVGKQS